MINETTTIITKIKKVLKDNLRCKYNIESDQIVDKLMGIHGLSEDHLDVVNFVETIIDNNINDVSIDDNGNKSNDKSIESIHQESTYWLKKLLGYRYLYKQMECLYGKDKANKLSGQLYDLSLGLSDSTNIMKSYCYAFDASKIVLDGLKNTPLQSKPPKHIGSYISMLSQIVHQMSTHLAGALAIGTLFFDVAHIALYNDGVDLRQLKTSKKFRKYIENEFQKFIHSVNHLSRNAIESPFTNVSIFDRVKLAKFVQQMSWYFPFQDLPIDMTQLFQTDEQKQKFCKNYIVDYIMQIQKIFLDFFDKGDPLKDGAPIRFPIATINLSKCDGKIVDKKFLRDICKRDIYRYNIFVSQGSKVASCCRLIQNTQMMQLASQSNSFGGGGSVSLGSHRVVTLDLPRIALQSKAYDDHIKQFYNILQHRIEDAIMVLKAHKSLLRRLMDRGIQKFMSLGWININRLFSTVGIIGIHQTVQLGDVDAEQLLRFINDMCDKYSSKINNQHQGDKVLVNIQQIPAQSFAIRFASVDKMIFGLKDYYQMYSNQFIPLWKDSNIWQKMDVQGKYNSLLTGGGIAHINIGQKTTATQNRKIIEYAVKSGCQHFALNNIYTQCENSHITVGKHNRCVKCDGQVSEYFTRIVGYFVPVSSFNKKRREWQFPKRMYKTIQQLGLNK